MKIKLKKCFGFTLIELLSVTVIIWFIMPMMIGVYSFLINSNKSIIARQNIIQQWYEFFERLNILMQDYTIDYEEYYNRQMVGCVNDWWLLTWSKFEWNIWLSWYCTEFTAYWNHNSTNRKIGVGPTYIQTTWHDIYDCSSTEWNPGMKDMRRVVEGRACWKTWSKQSYGQYKNLFTDMHSIADNYDDEDRWDIFNGIKAIQDDENIQELYLISHDWKSRLFFRRKLVPQTDTWGYAQYRIQMLRLRWFDAWQKHNFDATDNEWLYDWQIDTRACDTSMWFIWNWSSISWAYSDYKLPKDGDDCWADLTYWKANIYTRKLSISPSWDPELFWAKQERQINPYMNIFMVYWVYLPEFINKSVGSSIMDFKVPLQTTINMKDFYKE
jgi:hypothetical protein